jgi:hypothetical protein
MIRIIMEQRVAKLRELIDKKQIRLKCAKCGEDWLSKVFPKVAHVKICRYETEFRKGVEEGGAGQGSATPIP